MRDLRLYGKRTNMSSVLKCDRCLQIVEGGIEDDFSYGGYVVVGTYWDKYSNPGEHFVCDRCMWSNPRHIKDFGVMNLG